MKIEMGKLYAVITGDIVSFSKLPSEKRQTLSRIMKMGSEALRKTFKGSVPMEADVFRGDSWQLLVSDAALSLRIGLFLRAYLRAAMGRASLTLAWRLQSGRLILSRTRGFPRGTARPIVIRAMLWNRCRGEAICAFGFPGTRSKNFLMFWFALWTHWR